MKLLLFDREENLLRTIKNKVRCPHSETINGEDILDLTISAQANIEKGYRIVYKDAQENWKEFIVQEVEQNRENEGVSTTVFCESSLYETIGDFIEDQNHQNSTAVDALEQALVNSRWEVGVVDDLGVNSVHFHRISAKEAVSLIASTWHGEIRTRIVVHDNKIVRRFVDILKLRGQDTGKRFTYTKGLNSITRTVHRDDVITALYGFGSTEDLEDGQKLDFAEINNNKMYIADEGARLAWGRKKEDQMVHVFGVVEFPDIKDKTELLAATTEKLKELSTPRVSYEAKVTDLVAYGFTHEVVELGDNVSVIDKEFDPELRVKARVIQITRDLLTDEHYITLDNYTPDITDTWNNIYDRIDKSEEYNNARIIQVQIAANGKNKIFRGETEPTEGMLDGDLWFKPVANGEVEMYQWDSISWVLIVSSVLSDDIENRLAEAEREAEEAIGKANEAVDGINLAVANAGFTTLDATISDIQITAQTNYDDSLAVIQNVVDNKGTILGLNSINQAISDIENPSSNTWRDILSSESGHLVQYTQELENGILSSASTQTASQVTTALTDYTKIVDLDGKISNLLTSDITQTAGAINIKLTGYTKTTDLDGEISNLFTNGTTSTAQYITTTLSSYATTTDLNGKASTSTVNTIKSTADSNKLTLVGLEGDLNGTGTSKYTRVSSIEQTLNGVKTTVGNSSTGLVSQVTQLADSYSVLVSDVAGHSSQISTMTNNINLRVSKNDIIRQINISTESILLDSDVIHLGASTTIDNGVITNRMVAKDIAADKITAGTLNAANVSIINLNASNIVTGTLSSITINIGGGAFTVNSGGTLQAAYGGFKVPYDGDGVFNNFAPQEGDYSAARWKRDNSNYIYQDPNAFVVYMNGSSKLAMRQIESPHWSLRIGNSGTGTDSGVTLRALHSTTRALQIRNGSDSAFIPIHSSDFIVTSSRTFKENIKPLKSSLNLVKETPVYKFQYKDDKRIHTGFIAEESPAEIMTQKGIEEGAISLIDTLGTLWKAVQELDDKVELILGGN